jgi:hypothetical protein
MTTTLNFSGASDDLLHLNVTGDTTDALIDDDGTQSHRLDGLSAFSCRGWLVTPADGRPFAVYALLGPMGPQWHFAVGFPPGTDEDDGADIGMFTTTVRRSPLCRYSTELSVTIVGRCNVQAIPGRAAGA